MCVGGGGGGDYSMKCEGKKAYSCIQWTVMLLCCGGV